MKDYRDEPTVLRISLPVLVGIGWLDPGAVKRWQQGQIDYLEAAVQTNLPRISEAMKLLRSNRRRDARRRHHLVAPKAAAIGVQEHRNRLWIAFAARGSVGGPPPIRQARTLLARPQWGSVLNGSSRAARSNLDGQC